MSAYPWHIIGGVTADGLSFRTWRRGLVYTAEDTQDAKAKVSEAQDDFPHIYGLDNFRRGDAKVRTYILAALLAHRDAEVDSVRETAIVDFGRQGCHVKTIYRSVGGSINIMYSIGLALLQLELEDDSVFGLAEHEIIVEVGQKTCVVEVLCAGYELLL